MDSRLRSIISKAAGTYFIVTDKSQVATIEAENKMRLYFINSEKGPVNMLFKFAKGDITGFTSIFGKSTRLSEKRGNFSHATCLDGIESGPIAVINLRKFEDTDTVGISNMSANKLPQEINVAKYSDLFNTNSFWSPKPENIKSLLENHCVLNFGNVGHNDVSIFVVRSKNYASLTSEGEKSLLTCSLTIDEYPALDFHMLLKDTFVDVYVFNNTFDVTSNTNQFFGHLFNNEGNLDLLRLSELATIAEAGFVTKFTGSLIPGLKNESAEDISIDTIINQQYMSVGIIADINEDVFESETPNFIDIYGNGYFDETGLLTVGSETKMLSHFVPSELTTEDVVWPLVTKVANIAPPAANKIKYVVEKVNETQFITSFEQGIRVGNKILGTEGIVEVTGIDIIDPVAIIGVTEDTFTKVKVTCSGLIDYTTVLTVNSIIKLNAFSESGLIVPTNLSGYVQRVEQFMDGTVEKQTEILNMMLDPGIVKGIKSTKGLRYVIDCFKSFVEPGYKSQFGQLCFTLDEANRFVRAIINEPFIADLQKSNNPLFKQYPGGAFDWTLVPQGGNKNYSTKSLTKFVTGGDLSFFFGPGEVIGNIVKPLAGKISNLFYLKAKAFDVVANESGYLTGVAELESDIDDVERVSCEAFNYNPIIDFNGFTIYGNLSGQKDVTAQQQIHNSELLAYIKESLYNLSKGEAFKKGNYDDYLRTETETTSFMEDLVLAGAILPNPIVICNASNNTLEIQKVKIKLVHIEYTPVNSLEKVVFDLQIN